MLAHQPLEGEDAGAAVLAGAGGAADAASERAPSSTAAATARSVTTRQWQTITAGLRGREDEGLGRPKLCEANLTSATPGPRWARRARGQSVRGAGPPARRRRRRGSGRGASSIRRRATRQVRSGGRSAARRDSRAMRGVDVLVAALDQPVGEEQQPVARAGTAERTARGRRRRRGERPRGARAARRAVGAEQHRRRVAGVGDRAARRGAGSATA